jgi:hypothetical protein
MELYGIQTPASVTNANKLVFVRASLSGNSPFASAYVHTPLRVLKCRFLAQLVSSMQNAVNALTAILTASGIPKPALATANLTQQTVLKAPFSIKSAVNASSSPACTRKTAASLGLTGTGTSTPVIASVRSNSPVKFVQTALCPTTPRAAAILLSHAISPMRNAAYTEPTTHMTRIPALAIANNHRLLLELTHPA